MPDLTQPHDKLFKALTDDPVMAGALIRERLSAEIVALLSADPPEPIEGSFIDAELKVSQSDRLFRLHLIDGNDAFLYVLMEHKSSVDPELPLQLLTYMARIWRKYADRDTKTLRTLPPIVPLVFYHGAHPWTVPLAFADLIAGDDTIRRHHLNFTYGLVDLGQIEDDRLSQQAALRAGLLAMKYGLRDSDPWPVLVAILTAIPEDHPLLRPLLLYIHAVFESVDKEMLVRVGQQVRPEGSEAMVSLAAREWMAEGEAKGRAEGEAKGRAEGRAEGEANGKAKALTQFLRGRFGPVPDAAKARIEAADSDTLDRWLARVIDAPSISDVFDQDLPS